MKDIYILGIESSCDETSCSIVKNGNEELSTTILSQIDIHKNYGGVVPEIASRQHVKNITIVIEETPNKIFFSSRKRFSKNIGNVNELLARMVYLLSLLEINNQLHTVPINKPTAIQHWPVPSAYTLPGRPIRSQPLISDACADKAATNAPKLRPPRK